MKPRCGISERDGRRPLPLPQQLSSSHCFTFPFRLTEKRPPLVRPHSLSRLLALPLPTHTHAHPSPLPSSATSPHPHIPTSPPSLLIHPDGIKTDTKYKVDPRITLCKQTETRDNVSPRIRRQRRQGILFKHAANVLELALGLGVGLGVDPFLPVGE